MKKRHYVVVAALGLALCFCLASIWTPPVSAQTTYGAIAGTVTDPSNAAIADA
jgi:hypothetical protein